MLHRVVGREPGERYARGVRRSLEARGVPLGDEEHVGAVDLHLVGAQEHLAEGIGVLVLVHDEGLEAPAVPHLDVDLSHFEVRVEDAQDVFPRVMTSDFPSAFFTVMDCAASLTMAPLTICPSFRKTFSDRRSLVPPAAMMIRSVKMKKELKRFVILDMVPRADGFKLFNIF